MLTLLLALSFDSVFGAWDGEGCVKVGSVIILMLASFCSLDVVARTKSNQSLSYGSVHQRHEHVLKEHRHVKHYSGRVYLSDTV